MADAAHLLSDLAGFLVSLVAISVSKIPGDGMMTYGYARAEVLGAVVSIFLIWGLTGALVVMALIRIVAPEDVNGPLMFVIACFGLVVNVAMGLVLGHTHSHGSGHVHNHDHGHDHDHLHSSDDLSSQYSRQEAVSQCNHNHNDVPEGFGHGGLGIDERTRHRSDAGAEGGTLSFGNLKKMVLGESIASVNLRAAYLHVLGDILQNLGVLVASVVIWWHPQWRIADPLCTLFFSIVVIMTSKRLVAEAVVVLMEGVPPGISLSDVWRALTSVKDVVSVEDLHVWSLTVGRPTLSAHLTTTSSDFHPILKETEKMLREKFGMMHTTIQLNCAEDVCCGAESDGGRREHCVTKV